MSQQAEIPTSLPQPVGVVVVDHGSKRQQSNDLIFEVADRFAQQSGISIVEPAHMELASPSIADAFERCVAAGAKSVIIAPFFLAPGRHIQEDIPRLAAAAAANHPDVAYHVANPMGLHPGLIQALCDRVGEVSR